MDNQIPNFSNFYSSLTTALSKQCIAELFEPLGAKIRKCGWHEWEVRLPWAEFIIESEAPVLLHGEIADVQSNALRLVAVLRDAGIQFTAECYDESDKLLEKLRSD
jgi:hypothetical protein